MKELEDQPWFPAFLRDLQMRFIGQLAARFGVYAPLIAWWRSGHGPGAVRVDLCSGSGEPALSVHAQAGAPGQLLLTDLYPPRDRIAPGPVRYEQADARALAVERGVSYTMFNAIHHFTADEQRQLVERIHRGGGEAWFVEPLRPDPLCFCQVLLAGTLGVLLFMPFVRPFSWQGLALTYLLPVNVLTITWDGLVSVLHSSSAREYRRRFPPAHVRVVTLRGLAPLTVIHVSP